MSFKKRPIYGILCLFFLFSCSTNDRGMVAPDQEGQVMEDEYFVTQEHAEEIATAFFDGVQPILVGTDADQSLRAGKGIDDLPAYYIYSGQQGGYIIVSATERAYPVLGYAREGGIDLDQLPCGLEMVLGVYSHNIDNARRLAIQPSEKIRALRASLRAEKPVGNEVVAPLMEEIHWDQMPYYNALCPSPNVPVGCVATATSQIMRYWEYPETAKGHHTYNSENFGVQSHDYNYTINWEAMPKGLLKEPNYEVARLCYGVAVSIDMSFDYAYNGGSGAYQNDVPLALQRYYGYPKTVTNVMRYSYDSATWHQLMKNELDNGRPIQYGGSGSGGGHSFVLDGYDDHNYFHVNWGWGGQSDGWFLLDALDPDDLGTGGGSGGFNQNQHAVIYFAPPAIVRGDNDEPIIEEDDNDNEDASVEYDEVFILNTNEIYIKYTKFNGTETYSGAMGYTAYLDKKIYVTEGGKVEFSILPEVLVEGMVPAYVIAVDYNNDGKFDISEGTKELVILEIPGDDELFTGSFTIPSDIKKGNYRMRVNIDDNALYNPNRAHFTGEYEDYLITIK